MSDFVTKLKTNQGDKQIDFQALGNFPAMAVGQTLKVTAVDENGVPTAWEGMDPASALTNHRFKTFYSLAQVNSELTNDSTPFEVANAMPDYSILIMQTGGSLSYAGGLTPLAENGLLTITKPTIARVSFHFAGEVTGQYHAFLRSDASHFTGWYKLYDNNDIHLELNTMYGMSHIGQTVGSETIAGIATSMPNYSILIHGVTTDNAAIYPSNYGLLTVKRTFSSRIEFRFVTTAGVEYTAFYSVNSGGDVWTGWQMQYSEKNIKAGTTDLTAGSSELATGHLYFVYE